MTDKPWLPVLAALLTLAPVMVAAATAPDRHVGRDLQAVRPGLVEARLPQPVQLRGELPRRGLAALDPALVGSSGRQRVLVRLRSAAAARQNGLPSAAANAKQALLQEQGAFMARCDQIAPGARLLGQTQLVLNAVFIEVDAAALPALARDPAVARITPIANYRLHLGETVPYIGATAVQNIGVDGGGVTVAVLDSGIDYLHADLGGSGNPADYAANDPSVIEPGTFPTARVVGGFDFVGSTWPATPDEVSDPDPLDDGSAAGHGTHVADIIGGRRGVAPGVDLVAVKVCSSISTSCSGLALLLGMEYAVDPNGDGDPADRVDVINMSLGSDYGQPFDDDLSLAVNNASALGVLTVASAGNAGDKPYIIGSPAAATSALAVAETQVPSATLQLLDVDGQEFPAVFQPWSTALVGDVSGPVQYGDNDGSNLNGCAPFANDLTGRIVLVDRGACNFTLKIKNISAANGAAGIIGLVTPDAPFAGADGGDRPINIPGFMISQADSLAIQALIGSPGIGLISSANQLPLRMQVVSSSSRGPSNRGSLIKPEVAAPGASVSAEAGTGAGATAFGGTSGAAPMVSGAAALVLDRYARYRLAPHEVKSLLMVNADTSIDTDPFQGRAPISRIGGGEVRVDQALRARATAYDADTGQGAFSFGFHDITSDHLRLKGEVLVHNLSNQRVTYGVAPVFRYADDADSRAVRLDVPDRIKLNPGQHTKLTVKMNIDARVLPGNFMNSGDRGNNPTALTRNEFDGYIQLDDGVQMLEIPWHVLPRQAAAVQAKPTRLAPGGGLVRLQNKGVGTAQNDAYALIAVSANLPAGDAGAASPTPDIRALGVNTFPVPAGFCGPDDSFIWALAANTWERQTHLLPVKLIWYLDLDQDGLDDYAVLNGDLADLFGLSDGRQRSYALDLNSGVAVAFFFTEHATNTGNTVHYVCGDQLGLDASDFGRNINVSVEAFDFYFGGPGDLVTGLTIAPLGERFFSPGGDVAGNSAGDIDVFDFGQLPGNTPELGLLLLTNGDRGEGARGGASQRTEALVLGVRGADLSALKDKQDNDHGRDDDDDHGRDNDNHVRDDDHNGHDDDHHRHDDAHHGRGKD